MNIYNSEFYLQLAGHLATLQAKDFLEDDAGYDPFAPSVFVVPGIDNKTKKRVYIDNDFKKYLKEYIKRKFNIQKETITDEYSEEIYRKMYHKDLAKNSGYNLFTKVMYHPDVTNSDFEYISDKRARFFKNILYSELACFTIMLFTYYKTPFGKKLRNNMGMGLVVLGFAPIVTLFASQKLNAVLLNWKVRKMNLPTKYHIKDV